MPFLNLLPATSEGYPTAQPARKASTAETSSTTLTTPESIRARRSSSISSSDSSSSRQRFLKLGPVYFGGDPTESDWVEEAIKE